MRRTYIGMPLNQSESGPYSDIAKAYVALAERELFPITMVHESHLQGAWDELRDQPVNFVAWCGFDGGPGPRTAFLALVYVGCWPPMGSERDAWPAFVRAGHHADLVFCHTPQMAATLARECGWKTAVLPAGWDPDIMGRPDYEASLEDRCVHFGMPVGKRFWSLSMLAKYGVADISGLWGRDITSRLQHSRLNLNLPSFTVDSFSTWRVWQAVASRACLVAERGDSWPAIPDWHYISFPHVETEEDVHRLGEMILAITPEVAEATARRCHLELASFTVERCVRDYLVPQLP